jgi:glycosyltransferase involved in cell wall biosynthesis
MTETLPRTLFVAISNGAVAWYRCALPATVLGCDWIGVGSAPPQPAIRSGNVAAGFDFADAGTDYDVIVVQQVHGPVWLRQIQQWRSEGITVLYEIDDWLHGVRRVAGHAHAGRLDKAGVQSYERCMAAADGIICSTDWLARRYRSVNPVTWTCRNGIDLARYAYTRPAREHTGIGWAGGTGHTAAALPWVAEVAAVMRERPDTRFISVGEPFAAELEPEFGPRTLAVPFTAMEVYPAAMAHFDVALAPAGKGDYFKGKSDLRWLEAAALSVPCIADPDVYPEIEHGVTGFHASTPAEMGAILRELIADHDLRDRVGAAAHAHVVQHRTAQAAARAWGELLRAVAPAVARA